MNTRFFVRTILLTASLTAVNAGAADLRDV
jgi:hypothetical protein